MAPYAGKKNCSSSRNTQMGCDQGILSVDWAGMPNWGNTMRQRSGYKRSPILSAPTERSSNLTSNFWEEKRNSKCFMLNSCWSLRVLEVQSYIQTVDGWFPSALEDGWVAGLWAEPGSKMERVGLGFCGLALVHPSDTDVSTSWCLRLCRVCVRSHDRLTAQKTREERLRWCWTLLRVGGNNSVCGF